MSMSFTSKLRSTSARSLFVVLCSSLFQNALANSDAPQVAVTCVNSNIISVASPIPELQLIVLSSGSQLIGAQAVFASTDSGLAKVSYEIGKNRLGSITFIEFFSDGDFSAQPATLKIPLQKHLGVERGTFSFKHPVTGELTSTAVSCVRLQ